MYIPVTHVARQICIRATHDGAFCEKNSVLPASKNIYSI